MGAPLTSGKYAGHARHIFHPIRMTAEQTIQRPIQPPFASAACPRCGHRCEIDPEQPLAPVRCPDCGGEFVGGRVWDVALADPAARRRFAWALIVGGGACVLGIVAREAGPVLVALGVQVARDGRGFQSAWIEPLLTLMAHVAQFVSIPAQWMLLRAGLAEARRPRAIWAAWAWLVVQSLCVLFSLLVLAVWMKDRDPGQFRQMQATYESISGSLGGVPGNLHLSIAFAIPAGVAIMLLLLGLPSPGLVGRSVKLACLIIAAGIVLPFMVRSAMSILSAVDSNTTVQLAQSAAFRVIHSAATHWIPSATVAIGGLMLLRTGIRMRGAR
ncbi:MAG: hypothetical protein U0625_06770 [Phycisphaerales bacterium]